MSGGRGRVERLDRGEFRWIVEAPGLVRVELAGTFLAGTLDLTRRDDGSWTARLTSSDPVPISESFPTPGESPR